MGKAEDRREVILELLRQSDEALSGSRLGELLGVSRQIIVQDIALLKGQNHEIISTTRGYILPFKKTYTRILKMVHSDEAIQDELATIVDCGVMVKDVFITHKAYGKIHIALDTKSRREIALLHERISSGASRPLKNLTNDYHYHTLVADSEALLDEAEAALREKGFLALN